MDAINSQREEADKLIKQLQQEAEARSEEIAMLKEEEANQQEEKQLLLDEVQQLSEAVEHLKEKDVNIARLHEELEAVTDEKVKLVSQLASAEDELVQLKEITQQLQMEVERAKVAVSEAESRNVTATALLEESPDVAVVTSSSSSEAALKVEDVAPLVEVEAVAKVEETIPLHLDASSLSSSQDSASKEALEKVKSEMSDIQAELAKVKAVNEKLKAKLRAQMKKEKLKSESGSEHDSDELRADIEKVRQEKLSLEKSAHEMRQELDEIVRRKDSAIGDLKAKTQQLLDEKARNESLNEKYEKLVAQKDEEIQDLKDRYQLLGEEKDAGIQRLEKTLEREKLEYVQELENCKDGYEQVLGSKEAETENFQRDLANAKMKIEHLTSQLREAHLSLEELNKLKANFDHIVSGLREDLQQALNEKAAADQIAHEFRVQLNRKETSVEQRGTELEDVAVDTTETARTVVNAQLKASQEEVAVLKGTLETVNKEKEELQKTLEKLRSDRKEVDDKVQQTGADSEDGKGEMEGELTDTSSNVLWLQSELKKVNELNSKLKAALRKKRSKSDSREEETSSETIAELEKSRAAKLDSERKVQELREELDDFVKEKEVIVATLKSRIELVSQEKEDAISVIEEYEKQLLEKDSIVGDLTEQCQSLSLDNEGLNKSIEELTAINSELQVSAQDATDAKDALESLEKTNQSVISERNQTISALESQLENTKEGYERIVEGLKEQLSEKERKADESITELRQNNQELQENIQIVTEQRDDIEQELLNAKSELEQVIKDSYPVMEEKDRKINELEVLMEEKQTKTEENILQLQASERTLQERIQVLDARNSEIKSHLEEVQSELEKRLQDEEGLEEELAQAHSEINELNTLLQAANQDKQDINRLQSNFDHILSGLREDLQQALEGKAAADEIAHEFQVQLEKLKKLTPEFSKEVDGSLLQQENKISEMLEVAQHEVANLKAALEVTLKERDDLQNKISDFELSLQEKSNKEPISSLEVDWKYAERDKAEKVAEEVILQSSVDNQVTAAPPSEAEVELENVKNEMQRIKGLNDKLKAKLRAVIKKKRVKSDSGDEDTTIQAELQQLRQGKLDSEKACQQLRLELDAFVRQKESIVNELKSKIEQLVTEQEKSYSLVEELEQQIAQRDNELQDMRDEIRGLQNENDETWKIVQKLREENGSLRNQEQDLILQRAEIERECRRLKEEVEGLAENVSKKENVITTLEKQLEDITENYKTELEATGVQHKGVIFEIQSHADQLERELLSANKEADKLKGLLRELEKEKEDVAKLKVNFDHIVSGLREDLQHALEGKAAADQIAHEFQVQLKRLEKVSGKLETEYREAAVDTSDLEGREEILEKLEAAQTETDNLRNALQSLNIEKLSLEESNRRLEVLLQEKDDTSGKIGKEEKDGGQERIVSEILVQSPEKEAIQATVCESEALFASPPVQCVVSDSEDVQKVKDDLSKVQSELEKVKSVNERLKAKLRTVMRKTKEAKTEAGHEGSGEELLAELDKVRQEKLESEKTARELRVELDAFVREKEKIVDELKARIQKLLAEKEESSSLVEEYEKRLLDRDAEISSLGEEFQSLSEERDEVNRKLAENRVENQNLKALLEQLQLQKVKAERELQQATLQTEQLLEGHQPLLDEKDQQITDLQAELSNQKALYTGEMNHLKDRYETVISEQQNHVNNLEVALVSANTETEKLKLRVNSLEQERKDIDKLRSDFDHIVSGLSEDLKRALEGKETADEITHSRLDKSTASSDVEVKDECVGTEKMESLFPLAKDEEIQKLQAILEHLNEEKEELEERVTGLDEIVQDREGEYNFFKALVQWIY